MDPAWDIECPGCKRKVKIKLSELAAHKTVRCPSGHTFSPQGDDAKKVKRALEDLQKTFKRLGK